MIVKDATVVPQPGDVRVTFPSKNPTRHLFSLKGIFNSRLLRVIYFDGYATYMYLRSTLHSPALASKAT